ncbi:MAG: NAD(P)/FAD-dependent oxidoreductase [Oscillospiraceae bacterium]|nr:NAD(P)/FAD-dependent oxidoreductase [Oscillospiraceae bacterium]
MSTQNTFDVTVIGGGPGGLAAAIAAEKAGASVLLVEREERLGGILKQCVHDGFGLVRFGKKMAGPEYAQHFIDALGQTSVTVYTLSFVAGIQKTDAVFRLQLIRSSGTEVIDTKTLILATGCRERTARQVSIHGTKPAGVLTAGAAQHYTNLLGQLPGKRCVILGSGDIGLIMARRLTLEGAQVLGVYEAAQSPSGLPRNIAQCLHDFGIPLHLGKTVTRCFGLNRLEGVEVASTDAYMNPIPGTEERIACDTLILSVGLIPENELAESLGAALCPDTKGPWCDQNGRTDVAGLYTCGNAAHVNDLVDFVSESGETAGRAAALAALAASSLPAAKAASLVHDKSVLYTVPQRLDLSVPLEEVTIFFRSRTVRGKTRLTVSRNGSEAVLYQKTYQSLRPPEMERIVLPLKGLPLEAHDILTLRLEDLP